MNPSTSSIAPYLVPPGKPRGATILIVEDSPVQTELLRRALEGAGYAVIAAGNGAEGLALAMDRHPAAVVSDINMPVMDGYAMCQAMRREASLNTIPVILLTMLSDPEDVIRGLNAGADAYLTKPYDIPSLASRIEALLAHPPATPPATERSKTEVQLAGRSYLVDAHGPRMLNLLVSTYENAVLQNRLLAATQSALEDMNQNLGQMVLEKTAELRKSELRFRALIENGSDLVLVVDAQGTITYVSPSIQRVAGYEQDELLGKPLVELIHPEDAPTAQADLQALAANPGWVHESQLRYRSKDGDWIVLETIAKSAIDDPAIAGIVVNSRDITERTRDERRTAAMLDLSMSAQTVDEKTLLQQGLDTMQLLTNSRVGFLHFVSADQNRIELAAWTSDTLAQHCHAAFDRHYPVSSAGIWADSLRRKQPLVVNDYAAAPGKKGLPEGHAALRRFVSVPVFDGELVRMIVGVGNAASPYGERDIETVQLFAYDLYRIIQRKRAESQIKQQLQQLERSLMSTVEVATTLSELRDPYTAGHERRVAGIAAAIGAELGLDGTRVEGLRIAAHLHDVGKVVIPGEILSKPGKLSTIEFALIQGHAKAGYEVLKEVTFPWPVAEVALQHHERVDGSGYPRGLKGDGILLEARIVAVADVVEAMASHRPYRPALGIDQALAEIESGSGTRYDRSVADACLRLFREKGYALKD